MRFFSFVVLYGLSFYSAKSLAADYVEFTAIGDFNNGAGDPVPSYVPGILNQMQRCHPQHRFALGLGDYWEAETSQGRRDAAKEAKKFQTSFLRPYLNAGRSFFSTHGNHDAVVSSSRSLAEKFWKDPQNNSEPDFPTLDDGSSCGTNYPHMYCYIEGNVLFVSLDDSCYYNLCNKDKQLAWIDKVSQYAKRMKDNGQIVARIAYGHIPFNSNARDSSSHKVYENGAISTQRYDKGSNTLERKLAKNFDLLITGHTHVPFAGKRVYPDKSQLRIVSLPCSGSGPRRSMTHNDSDSRLGFRGYAYFRVNKQTGKIEYTFHEYKSQGTSCGDYSITKFAKGVPIPNESYDAKAPNAYIRDDLTLGSVKKKAKKFKLFR